MPYKRRSRSAVPKANGRPRNTAPTRQIRVWLPAPVWEKAQARARFKGLPVSTWARVVIENALLRVPTPEPGDDRSTPRVLP